MKPTVHDRDLELLSTYLDNQLSGVEKARLEKRLAAEPELDEALAGLRATVHAMRSLPPVKIPRNFTLDPRVYGSRQPSRRALGGVSFGFMRLATGIAMALFVVSVAGDFLARSGAAASPVPQAAEAAATASLLGAPESSALADTGVAQAVTATDSPSIRLAPSTEIVPAAPPAGGGQGGGGGGGGTGLEPGQDNATPEAAFLAIETAQPSADLMNEATVAADEEASRSVAGATPSPESTSKLGDPEAPQVVAEAVTPATAPAPLATGVTAQAQPWGWLAVAQVAFGVLAVVLGLATLWYRSRSA